MTDASIRGYSHGLITEGARSAARRSRGFRAARTHGVAPGCVPLRCSPACGSYPPFSSACGRGSACGAPMARRWRRCFLDCWHAV